MPHYRDKYLFLSLSVIELQWCIIILEVYT